MLLHKGVLGGMVSTLYNVRTNYRPQMRTIEPMEGLSRGALERPDHFRYGENDLRYECRKNRADVRDVATLS